MTPEHRLWQSVLLTAVMDATATPDRHAKNFVEVRNAKREADKWLRGNGRDFRQVCAMAGMDSDFIHEAYVAGRIDADLLRASQDGRKLRGRAA